MKIVLADIPDEGIVLQGEEAAETLGLDGDERAALLGPVCYELNVCLAGSGIVVTGCLSAEVSVRCSRCAAVCRQRVQDRSFRYVQEVDERTRFVDLTADIRESMLLVFPSYPVCRQSCKGLCPRCGADLNTERCRCKPSTGTPWGALDKLDVMS